MQTQNQLLLVVVAGVEPASLLYKKKHCSHQLSYTTLFFFFEAICILAGKPLSLLMSECAEQKKWQQHLTQQESNTKNITTIDTIQVVAKQPGKRILKKSILNNNKYTILYLGMIRIWLLAYLYSPLMSYSIHLCFYCSCGISN